MKIQNKVIYVARDDTEFDLQKDCELHEELLDIADRLKDCPNLKSFGLEGNPYELAVIIKAIMEGLAKGKEK